MNGAAMTKCIGVGCRELIDGGCYCRKCRERIARLNSRCTCVRHGDYEDVRGCEVHDPRLVPADV